MNHSEAISKDKATIDKLIRWGWIRNEQGDQAPLPKTGFFVEASTYTQGPRFDKDSFANNRAFKRT